LSVTGTLANVNGPFATNVSTACVNPKALICVSQ
jgi:hypothetical protein